MRALCLVALMTGFSVAAERPQTAPIQESGGKLVVQLTVIKTEVAKVVVSILVNGKVVQETRDVPRSVSFVQQIEIAPGSGDFFDLNGKAMTADQIKTGLKKGDAVAIMPAGSAVPNEDIRKSLGAVSAILVPKGPPKKDGESKEKDKPKSVPEPK